MRHRYLALDVGGTKIEAGIVREDGRVLAVNAAASHQQCAIEELLADIDSALGPLRGGSVAGLGIGFPALGDYQAGVLHGDRSLYPCVNGFPMRDHLAGKYALPVRMTTDANMFAAGIAGFGEGRHYRNMLALALGTGLGVGLILNGRLEEGSRGIPDEILRLLQESARPLAAAGHHFERLYGADGQTLGESAKAGDRHARKAFAAIGHSLAGTIRWLLPILPPIDAVIFGGGVARSWLFFAPALRQGLGNTGLRLIRTRLRYPALAGAAALFDAEDRFYALGGGEGAGGAVDSVGSPTSGRPRPTSSCAT